MPIQAFNHFNLRAERALLERLRDFYVDVVGLTEGPRPPFDFHGYWLYLQDKAVLHLAEAAAGATSPQRGTFDHVAFTCTGLAATEAQLRQRGLDFRRAQVPGTKQVQLFVRDPAGNGVEFNFEDADA